MKSYHKFLSSALVVLEVISDNLLYKSQWIHFGYATECITVRCIRHRYFCIFGVFRKNMFYDPINTAIPCC